MGNLSITLGSSFYSTGGDTINQKTWPTPPTGDGNSPGTDTDTGGSGGTGSGYDQATIDAITYFNNVLTRGYGDVDPSTDSYFEYDDGMGGGPQNILSTRSSNDLIWGSDDPTTISQLGGSSPYSPYSSNGTYNVNWQGLHSIDMNNVTDLDKSWVSASRTIPGYNPTVTAGDADAVWSTDGSNYGTGVYGFIDNMSFPTMRGVPFISLTQDIALIINFNALNPGGGYNMNGWMPSDLQLSSSGAGNTFNNFNSYSWGDPNNNPTSVSISLEPSKTVAEILLDFAKLFDSWSGSNTVLSTGSTASNCENLYNEYDMYGSMQVAGYDWSIGLVKITSIT